MNPRRLARILASAPGLAAARPGRALACPTCFSAKAGVLPAYLGTAVLLSLLPLALIVGIALWLRRRTRAPRAT